MKFPNRMIPDPTRLALSRRGVLGAGAAGLLLPGLARAQSALGDGGASDGGGAPSTPDQGPAINVSGAQNAPIPIAIPVFTDPSGAPSDVGAQITQVINDDLGHSGLFRAIDPASFVPNSMANGAPVWANWNILGAQALVTGDAVAQGGQLHVDFRLGSISNRCKARPIPPPAPIGGRSPILSAMWCTSS
jgi:TolB protein